MKAAIGEHRFYTKKAEERGSQPEYIKTKPSSLLKQQFEWENKQRKEAKEARNRVAPTGGYTKENLPLRPLLKKT